MSEKDLARFWSKVTKSSGCWEWAESKSVRGGYGELHVKGKVLKAHRIMYFLNNPLSDVTRFVCHKCDNPPCVNPEHLFLGTNLDNIKDMNDKGRNSPTFKKHPPKGELNVTSVLSEAQVLEMRVLRDTGRTYRSLGMQFGVSSSAAFYAIKLGWKHLDPSPTLAGLKRDE